MTNLTKSHLLSIVGQDTANIFQKFNDFNKIISNESDEHIKYLRNLLSNIPQPGSSLNNRSMSTKTRKVQKIQPIPENETVNYDREDFSVSSVDTNNEDKENTIAANRPRRKTSKRQNNIDEFEHFVPPLMVTNNEDKDNTIAANRPGKKTSKKQKNSDEFEPPPNITNNEEKENTIAANRPGKKTSKRQNSSDEFEPPPSAKKKTRGSRLKRSLSPDEDEEIMRPPKLSKIRPKKQNATDTDDIPELKKMTPKQSLIDNGEFSKNPPNGVPKDDETFIVPSSSSEKRSMVQSKGSKKATAKADETYAVNNVEKNFIEEASMYEDAIGKPLPIGNSTMIPSSFAEMCKMKKLSVVLKPLKMPDQMNETITIKKRSSGSNQLIPNRNNSTYSLESMKSRQQKLNKFEELLTEDESGSSIECKTPNQKRKMCNTKKIIQSPVITDDEDEIPNTPNFVISPSKTSTLANKNLRKPGILFSPFAKESVKKRVEAFEQVTSNLNTPNSENEQLPGRLTRIQTRALAAQKAAVGQNSQNPSHSKIQQLARKSLTKAKEILLAKQLRQNEDLETKGMADKKSKILSVEKAQKLWRTNSIDRLKIPIPVNRNQTPNNPPLSHYAKTLTGPRSKIITTIDSFLNPQRIANTADKTEEKKRKTNEEDARKKRDEALKLLMEEKKRKREEKELKNKLAREAKDKLEMEKRLKAEKEREEKARSAQQIQEKLKEETEKRRLANIQRAQEIEERRRLEEQLRLRRLQEQEETERLLMEQRRKEQEIEKRKEAEARAMQYNVSEAQKLKHQITAGQVKKDVDKHSGPTSYLLDSEPDEDESDHESQPKHSIPYWAHSKIRESQLAMQRYLPQPKIFAFFDTQQCTPDLTELFVGIDKSRLKRTSSAIWTTPPRFSIMERSILEP